MTSGDVQVLTIPGWTGSGPDHWQSLWERELTFVRRVEMPDWNRPRHEEWTAALAAALADAVGPAVLAAHSLGCIATVHWASTNPPGLRRVAGALLVAPPDVERPGTPDELRRFAPIPLSVLPFPSVVLGSSDDPWIAESRTRELAAAWGARYESLGAAGHINTAAGFGPFPRGKALLDQLVAIAAR